MHSIDHIALRPQNRGWLLGTGTEFLFLLLFFVVVFVLFFFLGGGGGDERVKARLDRGYRPKKT